MTEPPPQAPVDTRLIENGFREMRRLITDLTGFAAKLADNQRHQSDQTNAVLTRLLDMERRLDQRMVSVRDEIELMLKGELLGKLTHFETTFEQRVEEAMQAQAAYVRRVVADFSERLERAKAERERELAALQAGVAAQTRTAPRD